MQSTVLNALAIEHLSLERLFPIFIVGDGSLLSPGKSLFTGSLTVMTILLDDAPVIGFFSFFNLASDGISEVAVFCPVL